MQDHERRPPTILDGGSKLISEPVASCVVVARRVRELSFGFGVKGHPHVSTLRFCSRAKTSSDEMPVTSPQVSSCSRRCAVSIHSRSIVSGDSEPKLSSRHSTRSDRSRGSSDRASRLIWSGVIGISLGLRILVLCECLEKRCSSRPVKETTLDPKSRPKTKHCVRDRTCSQALPGNTPSGSSASCPANRAVAKPAPDLVKQSFKAVHSQAEPEFSESLKPAVVDVQSDGR